MAQLTPTGEAFDRATPGFDVLLNSLQSTTNRIHANRQFAKEVQAREDFAKFQADLNIDTERKKLEELGPIKLEQRLEQVEAEGELTTDIAIDREERLGPIRTDQAVDQQRQLTELQIEMMPDVSEAQVQAEIDKMDATLPAEKKRAQALANIQEQKEKNIIDHRAQYQKQENSINETISDRYGDVMDDPAVTYARPTINEETGEYNPVTVRMGDSVKELEYDEYLSYLEMHKNRKFYEDKLTNRLERSDQITETNVGNKLGVDGINRALNNLRANIHNPVELQNQIEKLANTTFSFKSTKAQNAMNATMQELSALGGYLQPGRSDYTDMQFDPKETDEGTVRDYVENKLVFGNVIRTHAEEGEDISDAVLNRISVVNENLPLIGDQGIPNNYRDMVYNWEFDPNADNVDLSRMFISVDEAVSKLRNDKSDIGKVNRATQQLKDILKNSNTL